MDTIGSPPPPKSRLYTRHGDDGWTRDAQGKSCNKGTPLFDAIGTIDELNSSIGCIGDPLIDALKIQEALFEIGAELAGGREFADNGRLIALEKAIDRLDQEARRLTHFVLPQGYSHLARAVCRRAERCLAAIVTSATVRAYINRLSDFLFALARAIHFHAGRTEKLWIS